MKAQLDDILNETTTTLILAYWPATSEKLIFGKPMTYSIDVTSKSLWKTRSGDWVITGTAHNRDGNFRTFRLDRLQSFTPCN